NNNTYQLGASNEYNALAIYERSAIVSNFDEWNLPPAPPGGPQSGGSGGCDVWRATCTDNSQFSEASCSTQQIFNSTWWNSWPGGGYGRWQYEACQNHGGVTTSVCPNQQQDPIRWCVTLDCPNGDTNGDNRCTVDDGGGYTQEYNSGPFCNYPRSGQGDINIYSGGQSQIDWNTYCGTTYKYLTSGSVPTSTPVPTLTPTPTIAPPSS